ncbi:MAG: discoidin domain-containing protein, partial [Planctomycetota bacterium]
MEKFELLTPDPGTFKLSVSNATVSTAQTGTASKFGNRTVYPAVPTDTGVQATIGPRVWRFSSAGNWKLEDFGAQLLKELRRVMISGPESETGIADHILSAAQRKTIADSMKVTVTRVGSNSATVAIDNVPFSNWGIEPISGYVLNRASSRLPLANPIRMTFPSATFTISAGKLDPIKDIKVTNVAIGETYARPSFGLYTEWEELKLRQGGSLEAAFFKRNVVDSNGIQVVPGNSFGLYGGQVPLDFPAVNGVVLGSSGTTADLGNATLPGLIFTNGQFHSLRTPIPSFVAQGKTFTSSKVGSSAGLTLSRFPRFSSEPRSYTVTGGASLKNPGGVIGSDLRLALGGEGTTGLTLLPDTDKYTFDSAIVGQFLLGSGILAQSSGTKFERDSNGKLILSGGALLDLNASAAHTAAEVNAGTAKPKGKLVRGRFALDYTTPIPANELTASALNWFVSDPTADDPKNQTLRLLNYDIKGRNPSQNPLRLTIEASKETLQGAFSTAAGGGVLSGAIEPVTLKGGSFQSSVAGPMQGRYVRIELPSKQKQYLHLAEVQVFAPGSMTNNLAASGTASQISTEFGGNASLAIDGKTTGDFSVDPTSHTKREIDPWWEVDLKSQQPIGDIVVWNRTDGGVHNRLANFKIVVLDENRNKIWEQSVATAPFPSVKVTPSGTGLNLAVPVILNLASTPGEPSGFVANGVLMEDGGRVPLSQTMELKFRKSSVDGAILSEGAAGAEPNMVKVQGNQLQAATIKSTVARTVGDLNFSSLDAVLDTNATPRAWRFTGPATYFGNSFNVGSPGTGNPQLTIGGSAGQQIQIKGIPGLATPPSFPAPPVIQVAGLTFDLGKLTQKAVNDVTDGKEYTYTSNDYPLKLGAADLTVSGEVTFKVSAKGVEIKSFSGTLQQNSEFTIGNGTIKVDSITVKYDVADKQLEVTGSASFSFMAGGANVEATISLGDATNPGLVIKDGVVESFQASITGSLDMMKLSIQVTDLTVKYNKQNSQYSIWGSVAISTQTQGGVKVLDNLSVTLGDENTPGIVIEGGQFKSFDFEVNGDINLFNMTASPQNLRVTYDRPTNQLQITGKLAVTLAPNLTVTAGLPGDGLLIDTKTGKVKVRGLSLEAESDLKFGALTISNLAIEYQEDSNGDVSISGSATVGLPSGIELGGELKIVNGKLDTIGFSFEKRPGIAVGKGIVYIYGIEGKLEGLSDLNNFKLTGTVRATVGPSVKFAGESHAYSDIEGTVEITQTSMALKGTATYVGGYMGTGGFEGKLDWSNGTVIKFEGHNTVQGGIIVGRIGATIDVKGNLDFKGGMEVKIPDKVPAVGGTSLGRIDVEMRIRPHDAPSASYVSFKVSAGADLGIAKLTLSGRFKLDFGGTAHYNLGGAVSIDLPWPLDDINISKSFNGSFKLFDGTKPVIEILAANGIAGSPNGEVVYNVQTALPENTFIDLYADTDNMGNDGLLIASGIPYQQGSQTFTWAEMTSFAKPGDPIYVYAVVSDGDNARVYSDYSSEFNVATGFTPSVTVPPAIKSEFGELIEFAPTAGRAITVTDPRSNTNQNSRLEIVLRSRKGQLDFSDVPADIEYVGAGTTSMTVTGSDAAINKALEMLIYYPDDLGDVEPDAVEISVVALPNQGIPPVTEKVDITFDSVMLFFNGSNAGQNVGGSTSTLDAVEVTAGAYGETPLDGIEVHSFKTEFLSGAQVKINGFEKDKEFLQLPMWAVSDYGIEATFSRRTGILTLTGENRVKDFEIVLAAITYDTMTPGSKSLEVSLIDQSGAKNKLTVPVTILQGVTPPKVDVGLTGLEFKQGDAPQPLNVATQIDIPDGETIRLVKFEFEAGSFVENEDVLAFDAATFNSASGSSLTTVWDHELGAFYLEGTADEDAWNAAVQQVKYQSLGGTGGVTLTEGQRYVSITVTDGTGNVTSRTVAIDVSTSGAANNSPELTLSTNDVTLDAHETMMVLDADLTLASSTPRLIEAEVKFLDGYFEGEYELAFGQSWPGVTSQWDPMEGSLRIFGVGTTWEYEDILRSVKVVSLLGRRFPGAMSLSFTVNDGLSATESEPLSIQVETAPFLQADLDNITDYAKGKERVRINDGFWIDTDDTLSEARVSIAHGYRKGEDLLIFDPSASAGTLIQGDFDADTGVLTLTGLAAPLDYEEAFRGVFYENSRHNPVAGDRVITYQLETDIAESNTLNAIIKVKPEVVPPTITLGQVGEFT